MQLFQEVAKQRDYMAVLKIFLAGVVLAPRASEELCTLIMKIPHSYPKDIRLECTIGAQGAAPRQFALVATPATIAAAATRARAEDPTLVTTDVFTIETD